MANAKYVSTPLSDETYEELRLLAKSRDRSMSAEVRMAIAEHLATARRKR